MTPIIHAVIFDFWGVIFNPNTQQLNPGLRTYVQLLHKGHIACGIASSSVHTMITDFLEKNFLSDYFPVIIGQEDVTYLKPNPECYLLAAQKLQQPPEHCLVIDDTAEVIATAKAAGFQTIWYGHNGQNFDSILTYA